MEGLELRIEGAIDIVDRLLGIDLGLRTANVKQFDVEQMYNYMFGERRWLRSDSEVLFLKDSSAN
jgi:hypothetical protein